MQKYASIGEMCPQQRQYIPRFDCLLGMLQFFKGRRAVTQLVLIGKTSQAGCCVVLATLHYLGGGRKWTGLQIDLSCTATNNAKLLELVL